MQPSLEEMLGHAEKVARGIDVSFPLVVDDFHSQQLGCKGSLRKVCGTASERSSSLVPDQVSEPVSSGRNSANARD